MLERENDLFSCPLMYSISVFSGKWKPFIIWYLSISPNQTMRYGALKRSMPYSISHQVFARQLQELERDGVIVREVFDEKPARVEYSMTEKGRSLANVMYFLRDWGVAYGDFDSSTAMRRTRSTGINEELVYLQAGHGVQPENEGPSGERLIWVRGPLSNADVGPRQFEVLVS